MRSLFFIAPYLYPHVIGGMEVFNSYLIDNLSKENDVSYLSKTKINSSAKYKRLYAPPKLIYIVAALYVLFRFWKKEIVILSFMRSYWYFWILYPMLNLLFGKQYIVIIHGGGLAKWNFKLPYEFFFKRAAKIIGVSKRICEEYSLRTGKEIILIPPLIPFESTEYDERILREKNEINTNEKVILFVGSLKPLKNPMILIKALAEFDIPYIEKNGIKLIFAGDGNLRTVLYKECTLLGLKKYIRFVGFIKREKITELYKIANIFVIPSLYEGTPIVLLEAMFNKLPIIAANSPGITDLIIDEFNGLLFKNNESKDLAMKIEALIANPSLAQKLSVNSFHSFCTNYSYDILIRQYKGLLDLL